MPVTMTRPRQRAIELDGGNEALVEPRGEREHRLRLEPQHALGEGQEARAVHHARSRRRREPAADGAQLGEEARQIVEPEHVGAVRQRPAVGERAIGVLVHLHEEGVHARRHRGAREQRHVAGARRPTGAPARPGSWTEWVASKITG